VKRATQDRSAATSAILLVWAASLIVAFMMFRSSDVGRLPSLASSFFRSLSASSLFGTSGLANSAVAILIAALIVLSWYGLGHLLLLSLARRLRSVAVEADETRSMAFDVAVTCALGAGAWSLLWFALGAVGAYKKGTALVALPVGLGLFALALRRGRLAHEQQQPGRSVEVADAPARAALFLIIFACALALVAALAPPTAKDTLLYHISLPRAFIAAGGFTDVPYNIANFLPLGAEMHGVWAMLLGGFVGERTAEAAYGATLFAFFPLLVAFVYGWARQRGLDRAWAIIAALLIASIPTAYYVAASGYIDLALSLYTALAVQALARWSTTLDDEQLVRAALALGFALGIKLTAIFVVLPLALIVLLRARQAQEGSAGDGAKTSARGGMRGRARGASHVRRIVVGGLGALLLACVVASPWYIRTWARTGSPVFPFYLNIWKGSAPGWDAERSLMFQEINSWYGGQEKNALSYLAAPVRLSLMGQPDQPAYYDGVIGVAFLFGLPLVVWAWWRSRLDAELKIAAGVSAMLFIFWLFSSEQARYLLPALPALAVAVAASSVSTADGKKAKNASRVLKWTLLCVGVAGSLTTLAWFVEQNPLRVVLGGETRRDYLSRRLDYYPYYELVNSTLPASARVWLINMRRDTYYIERPYFSDYMFEDYTIKRYVEEADTAAAVRARARAAGITHLLVRHDVLLDYARSPIVDDRRSRAQNMEKMRILQAFLTEGTKVIRSDERFMLIELPPV
jgi:hypothetical protein